MSEAWPSSTETNGSICLVKGLVKYIFVWLFMLLPIDDVNYDDIRRSLFFCIVSA